ncbi:MAG: hypothetical protein ACT4O2_10670, partial [Beijerinckiaceae bacterium]
MAETSDSIPPMRLDWNDIKARAARFAEDWNAAQYERGETQTFYNDLNTSPPQGAASFYRAHAGSFSHEVLQTPTRRLFLAAVAASTLA